jgi:hypothetical protein
MATPAMDPPVDWRCGRGGASRGSGRRRRRRSGRTGLAIGVNAGNELLCDDRSAIADQDFCQHACRRRRHFEDDLVGLNFDQDLVGRDGLSRLLLPLQHRGFSHRFGQLRYFDFDDCHFNSFGME